MANLGADSASSIILAIRYVIIPDRRVRVLHKHAARRSIGDSKTFDDRVPLFATLEFNDSSPGIGIDRRDKRPHLACDADGFPLKIDVSFVIGPRPNDDGVAVG